MPIRYDHPSRWGGPGDLPGPDDPSRGYGTVGVSPNAFSINNQWTPVSYLKNIIGTQQQDEQGTTSPIIWNNITQGTNLPIMTRDSFFEVLQSWESAIPLQSLWMIFFDIPAIVTDDVVGAWGEHIIRLPGSAKPGPEFTEFVKKNPIEYFDKVKNKRGYDYVPVGQFPNAFGTNTAKRLFDQPKFNRHLGCAFAQTVSLPPEQSNIGHVGVQHQRGFIKGPVHEGRQVFSSLNIEFLETNLSFVDFLIRPWKILTDHFGFIARNDVHLRTNITLINFARAGVGLSLDKDNYGSGPGMDHIAGKNTRGFIPRKIWIFQDCCPINITAERFSHTPEGDVPRRDTEWNFSRYQVFLPSHFESTFKQVEAMESNTDASILREHDKKSKLAKEKELQEKLDEDGSALNDFTIRAFGQDKRDWGFPEGLYKFPEPDFSTLFTFWSSSEDERAKMRKLPGFPATPLRQAFPNKSANLQRWLTANKAVNLKPELEAGGVKRKRIVHGPPRWDIFGLLGL